MYRKNRVVAVVRARMNSAGLFGSVLMPLAERPVLWHVIRRLRSLPLIDEIVVATGRCREDDGVASFVEELGDPVVRLFRGPEEDVLERYYLALSEEPPDVVADVRGGAPLVCISYLMEMICHLIEGELDGVVARGDRSGLTSGFEADVLDYQALVDAHLLAADSRERREASLFIRRRPQAFRLGIVEPEPELCSDFRLALEYSEDYLLLRELYDELYQPGEVVGCRQALEWLRSRPEVARVNGHCGEMPA